MKEFKFRVWDRFLKKMLYADIECYISNCGSLTFCWESIPQHYCDFGDTDETLSWNIGDKNHIVIQQYTGLKDKNKVEIYDGDLLFSSFFKNNENPVIVSWNHYKLCWEINVINGQAGPLLAIHKESYEVVGNIFEGVNND